MKGKVYLVGAGPGDPELITRKGARLLAEADAVVYDFLANPELLTMASSNAEVIYVGKKGGDHTMAQEEINRLLVDLALSGKNVVRLKGGDPFVFGRGGEEASVLAEAGVAFQVVPGVTSAVAAPSYAGIPVTDRRHSTEVAFVTGHEDPTKPESTIKWESLAGLGTLVFLMGIKNLPNICKKLMENGKPPETPAACVRWGATPEQESLTGTLATLPDLVKEAGIKPPAITVVGHVVELRDELSWFEKLPLFGKSILVTRARSQAGRLSRDLAALGAKVVEIPTIAIHPPQDKKSLDMAAGKASGYDWLIFTSPNGVEAFFAALNGQGLDCRALSGVKLAVIGPATGQALSQRGLEADIMAKSYVAEGLLEALAGQDLKGKKVLIPRAEQAREILPQSLKKAGAEVDVIPAYRTLPPEDSAELLAKALEKGLDVITFSASSTVTNLMKLLTPELKEKLVELSQSGGLTIAAIGPITAETARKSGLKVDVTPDSYTIPALAEALAKHFSEK